MGCNFKHAQVIKQFFFFALNVKIKTVRLENHHVTKIKKNAESLQMPWWQGACWAHEALVQLPVLHKRNKKIFVNLKNLKWLYF